MLRQYELVERVKAYDPDADEAILNRAYVYTVQKHGTQKRASGDPYFSHPIEVAGLMTELKLDQETIVTALLHNGLQLTGLVEHDSLPWEALAGQMEPVGGGEYRLADRPWRLPHSYTLQATKPA